MNSGHSPETNGAHHIGVISVEPSLLAHAQSQLLVRAFVLL
jgi:hypothetical protein